MNLTFSCPHCDRSARVDLLPGAAALVCPHCRQSIQISPDALDDAAVDRCLVCPSTDLFVRKDFPQRLGVTLVTLGILASCVAWGYSLPILTFAILFATAAVDVLLYMVMPDALMCYRCGAQYRSAAGMDQHGAFDLEIHERHRQQAARMAGQRH